MSNRIAILGAGAVGTYIGAYLSKHGYAPTLIDMWGAHVDRLNGHGARIIDFRGDQTIPVRAVHLADARQLREPFDFVFLAVKSYDTEWATHLAKDLLRPDGCIVSAQNCMNDDLISSIVGHNREIPCVIGKYAVALWEPGVVTRRVEAGGGPQLVFRVGEQHGHITQRVEDLARMLECVDGAKTTTNIWGERWAKLALNAASNTVIAITGCGSQETTADTRARMAYIKIVRETVLVAQALNYRVEPVYGVQADVWARADKGDAFEECDASLRPDPKKAEWRSSMAQDIIKGRKTEIEQMNGFLVAAGRKAGVPTPANAAMVEVVRDIEAGRLKPQMSNVDRFLSRAIATALTTGVDSG